MQPLLDLWAAYLPHAYLIELIQCLASAIGGVCSIRGTWDAWGDVRYVRHTGLNGARQFIGRRNLFEESIRLLIHVLFLYNGYIVCTYPPPGPHVALTEDRYFQMIVTRGVMTAASVLLAIKSARDISDRRKLREILSERVGSDLADSREDGARYQP